MAKRKYRSDALRSVHKTVDGLHRVGLVDKKTMHTLDLRMITTSHFMHETYGPFDAPLAVEPPAPR